LKCNNNNYNLLEEILKKLPNKKRSSKTKPENVDK